MKTYLLNIPQRLKLRSQELDVQAVLCNKAWSVFNDEGVKQLFIFQPDGTLYITTNGNVSNGIWKYIPANQSIIISSEGKSVMFHPAFLDDVIFALEMDGNSTCLFMIDEKNKPSFSPKSLTELGAYFTKKEQQQIQAEQQRAEDETRRIEAEIKAAYIKRGKELEEAERKKEEAERLTRLYGREIQTLSNGLSIRYNGTFYYISFGDRILSRHLDEVFADSLYLNCFITVRLSNELVFLFWDKDHVRLQECFGWQMEGDMFYCFKASRWIYGGDYLPYYNAAYDRGRLVNGNKCVDILQKKNRYSIVQSKIIGNPNPVPSSEVKKTFLHYLKRQIWWVVVIIMVSAFLFIDNLSWTALMDFVLHEAIGVLIFSVLSAILVSWFKTPYSKGIDGKYYSIEKPHLSSSTVIWAQECD